MPGAVSSQRETTSIKVKPDLWKMTKIEAIKQGITVSEFVEQALEAWMRQPPRSKH